MTDNRTPDPNTCDHGVPLHEECDRCWHDHRVRVDSRTSNEQFLDGTLKFGSVEGSRTGDPSVLQVSDPSEGQKILLSVNEARALHLWLGMVLPHSSAPETGEKRAYYETHDAPHCPTCWCGMPSENGSGESR